MEVSIAFATSAASDRYARHCVNQSLRHPRPRPAWRSSSHPSPRASSPSPARGRAARGGRRVTTRVDNRIILRDDIVAPMRRARVSIFRASFRDRDGRVDDDDPSAASPNDAAHRITAALLSASVLMTSAPGDALAIAFPNATETLFPTEASPTLMNIPDGTPTKLDARGDRQRPALPRRHAVRRLHHQQATGTSRYSLDATETPSAREPGLSGTTKGTWSPTSTSSRVPTSSA